MKVYVLFDKNGYYADMIGIYSNHDAAISARIKYVEPRLPNIEKQINNYISEISNRLERNSYKNAWRSHFEKEILKSKEGIFLDFLTREYPIIEMELDTEINYSVYCE